MLAYIVKRLLLMIPTLIGILLVSFAIIQFADFLEALCVHALAASIQTR